MSNFGIVILLLIAYYCAFVAGYHFALWRKEKVGGRNAEKEETFEKGDSDR